ncbi:MAG TPA: Trk system potassium transporter TrkA [Gammaproteobacteria bacterium]|nr:Trk system potassium transporter TrkA [Gammaproteobacteria bacterium]
MKIIIIGAGRVGSSVAENLASEANDVTLIDVKDSNLRDLQDKLDIRAIIGLGTSPSVLRKAGAEDADMIIAVTDSDDTNIVACQVAHSLFRTPTKIARIRSQEMMRHKELYRPEAIPIDVIISPEQLVTDYIRRLVEQPGALQVMDFANGRVQLVAVRAYYGGPLVGHELRSIREHMPNLDTYVPAIFRRGEPILPTGDTIIEADDEVFFIAAKKHIRKVMSELRRLEKPNKRIMIAGGGNIGASLADELEHNFKVKIIERHDLRSRQLSESLTDSIVLVGDAADRELLFEENIETTDVFCALTNDDEANILSSMLAKKMGARTVMALINRPAYVDLIESGDIDIAISPQQITIGKLLAYVRRGDVERVHSLRRGAAEAIEAVAHGSPENSKVVGRMVSEIPLPQNTSIGAVVRGDEVFIAHPEIEIQSEDHVILFLLDKRRIHEVERLFQVDYSFV